MIICHCNVVTNRCVGHAVKAGARTLAHVCRATGAGQHCGTCVLSVKRAMHADEHHRLDLLAK
jgi:bacterioferritin-associated ferredoxin